MAIQSHGFNGVHGRMPAIATGVMLANKSLISIGVSGDGDTASIGMGQFVHLLRRNVPMIYIIENNGVYGLTKGQFSATADLGSKAKSGVMNDLPAIDVCAMAIELGCNFVARSFAGDPKQMVELLKAALGHRGTAMFDVISPCVTFNNHEGSTKSYKYAKDHEELLHEISYVPFFEQISVNLARPYQGYGAITQRETTARSNYWGILSSFRHNGGAAGSLTLNYTLSRNQTDASNDRDAIDIPQNPLDLAAEYADARTDRRHGQREVEGGSPERSDRAGPDRQRGWPVPQEEGRSRSVRGDHLRLQQRAHDSRMRGPGAGKNSRHPLWSRRRHLLAPLQTPGRTALPDPLCGVV